MHRLVVSTCVLRSVAQTALAISERHSFGLYNGKSPRLQPLWHQVAWTICFAPVLKSKHPQLSQVRPGRVLDLVRQFEVSEKELVASKFEAEAGAPSLNKGDGEEFSRSMRVNARGSLRWHMARRWRVCGKLLW